MQAQPMMDEWYSDSLTTWSDVLDTQGDLFADKTLFVFEDQEISYGDFRDAVDAFAKGLINIGVKKNEVVGIWMTNSLNWVICQFAVYKAGAVLLPLYSYYRQSELEYALNQANVSVLIMADKFLGKVNALKIAADTVAEMKTFNKWRFASKKFPNLYSIVLLGDDCGLPSCIPFAEVPARGVKSVSDYSLLKRQKSVTPFDVMNIMYTSGTTGFPKGGMSMHVTNLVTTGLWSALAELTPEDVILCHVPLFTNFGGLYGAPLGMRNGCKVIITEQFDAAESLRIIEEHGVTYIPGTPSIFRMLLDHEDITKRDLSSVTGGHVAGAHLTETTMSDILNVLGAKKILQAWGLSECGGLSTVSTQQQPLEKRLKSVGKPLPSSLVRIIDSESGQEATQGVQGEIQLGDRHPGSCVGKGYFNMLEKTAETITPDGWFRTGDVGYFDEEGYLYVTGRVDDMFTVGGFNIYPAEIENKLEQLSGISEAYIVPAPDRRLGNVPVAWVQLEDGAELPQGDIIVYCRQLMSPQKVPRRVIYYSHGELPLTPTGKLKKKELADITARRIKADQSVGEHLEKETQP